MASALAEVFQGQFGLLDVEVWVEPFAGGAGVGFSMGRPAGSERTLSLIWACRGSLLCGRVRRWREILHVGLRLVAFPRGVLRGRCGRG